MRYNRWTYLAMFTVLGSGIVGCGSDSQTKQEHLVAPPLDGPRRTVIPGSDWSISIDNPPSGPRYLRNPFAFSGDTLWLTIKDGTNTERFDASYVGCDIFTGSLRNCSVIQKYHPSGTKFGLQINLPYPVQDVVRADLWYGTGYKYSQTVTYRMRDVTTKTLSPLTPTVAYGATRQFTTTALDAWGNNVLSFFPPAYFSTNAAVGYINSSGLFTASGCGTTDVGAAFTDGFSNPTVQTTVTVTCPYEIRSLESPIVRLVGEFSYGVTVRQYNTSGAYLGNVTPSFVSILNASIASVSGGGSALSGLSEGSTTLTVAYPGAPTISVPVRVFTASISGPSTVASADSATFTGTISGPGGPYAASYWTNGEEGGASLFTHCSGQLTCKTVGSNIAANQAIYLTIVDQSTGQLYRKGKPVSVP